MTRPTDVKRVAVLGAGTIGASWTAWFLARDGHEVVGVDPQSAKVDLVNSGRSPIVEKQVDELIGAASPISSPSPGARAMRCCSTC